MPDKKDEKPGVKVQDLSPRKDAKGGGKIVNPNAGGFNPNAGGGVNPNAGGGVKPNAGGNIDGGTRGQD